MTTPCGSRSIDELEALLAAERSRRESAEFNARQLVASLRELGAGHNAAVSDAVATARADERQRVLALTSVQSREQVARTVDAERRMRQAQRDATLWKLFGEATVRGSKIHAAITVYAGLVELLDDGTPVVKETRSRDVVGYLSTLLRERDPEWLEESLRVREAIHSVSTSGVL